MQTPNMIGQPGLHSRRHPESPYGKKTHLRFRGREVYPTEASCRFPLVVLQQTTQSFLATHNSVLPARPSIRQGEEEPVLLALVIALLEFLVYGSGDLRKHASPNHSRASLKLIVEPGLYRLLRFQKAAVRGNYETGTQAFSTRVRLLAIREQLGGPHERALAGVPFLR